MKEKYLSFGEYIRKKRLADPRGLTLHDIAEYLGVTLQYVSAVENRTKHPFDGETLGRLAKYLELSEEDTDLMYDIVSRETHEIPFDIEEIFAHETIGELARYALRLSLKGALTEEDWREFIRLAKERVVSGQQP